MKADHYTRALAPAITTSGTPAAVNTIYGTPSSSSSFSASGSSMTAGILITAPAGFEVSTDNVTFAPNVNYGSAGNIPAFTIYIRLASTTSTSTYSGNVVLSSAGATDTNVLMPNSTVSAANLTVTALDVNKTYGQALTAGSGSAAFSSTGLKNGEAIGTITIGYGPGAAATDGIGTYQGCISAANATGGTFTPSNYNIQYIGANIIVAPAILTITAKDVTKIYGDVLTGSSGSAAFTSTGLQNGETIGSVTIGFGSGSAAGDGVGTYINCVTAAAAVGGTFSANNYTMSYVPANIVIQPAQINVTANNVTKIYGQTLTDYTGSTAFAASGLKNGEGVSTVSIYYGTGAQANYKVQPCNQCVVAANAAGSFDSHNYTVNYISGDINVTRAPLLITADNQARLYGENNPVLTVSYTGLANGDTGEQLATKAIVTTTATPASPPGQYPITVSGTADPNYDITYADGTLTITESFTINNAFTPNGDGVNDTWSIQFLNNNSNCTVSVFDRQGRRVYYSNGYPSAWDGTLNGSPIPTGTYYYVIDLKSVSKKLSGPLSVLR